MARGGNAHDHRGRGHRGHEPPLPPGVAETVDRTAGDYLYEPDRLVSTLDDLPRVERYLDERRGTSVTDIARHERLGVALLEIKTGRGADVPTIVDELHALSGGLRVGPSHVLGVNAHLAMVPVAPPRPAPPLPLRADEPGLPGEGVRIAALDTGAWAHPWFMGRVDFRYPEDLDVPDQDGDGRLDWAAGHGTFIAGTILQYAPRATVVARRLPEDPGPAPNPAHLTDLELATMLLDTPELLACDVLTLSVGGYTHDAMGLLAFEGAVEALRDLTPGLVIVAGAGNEGAAHPFFPAASPLVVGVGALDNDGRRACFSNHGWWVDACAPGVDRHSTFLEWDGPMAPYPDHPPEPCKGEMVVEPPKGDVEFTGGARWDGTSFAAPQVAAVLAGLISEGRSGPEAVADLLHDPSAQRLKGLGTVVIPARV
ncbi:S8 family peptidase [Egibacter rhizosphaerae]|nr:S8/S53 family peptidase [Egibacter rhizosphaerae]